jgi:hypothetical protein
MNKSNLKVTKDMFKRNIDLKLNENSFLDDIGPLLSFDMSKTHSKPITTQRGSYLTAHDGARVVTEGWSLWDAVKEVENHILAYFPL